MSSLHGQSFFKPHELAARDFEDKRPEGSTISHRFSVVKDMCSREIL